MPTAEILLVEDKDSLRQMLRLTLQNAGHTVDEARDGAEARRRLNDTRYNLVLTDLKMPRADGLEGSGFGYRGDNADGVWDDR